MISNNIILIGMPAAGKSTVGVIIAKKLGYAFLDTDLIIQTRRRAKLQEIIQSEGIETFLDIESDVCCSLTVAKTVIATGGSVIYSDRAMEHVKKLHGILSSPFYSMRGFDYHQTTVFCFCNYLITKCQQLFLQIFLGNSHFDCSPR